MGASQSQVDPKHIGIYKKLIAIQNPHTRLQMIDTLLGDPSIVYSAKLGGVYANILQAAAAIRHGKQAPPLPGEQVTQSAQQQPQYQQPSYQQQPSQQQSFQQLGAPQQRITTVHPTMYQTPAIHTTQQPQYQQQPPQYQQIIAHQKNPQENDYYKQLAKPKKSEKALNFFSACLRVLNIQDEVALTEETLKSAYKKAVIRAHPDKPGGSKEAFDAVTRAFAYLGDILKLVQGNRQQAKDSGPITSLDSIQEQRSSASNEWKMPAQPVKLNPNNLNMSVFNNLFEQTRIPDPDDDGYGDWLKGAENQQKHKRNNMKKFSEEFNRDLFNQMFEDDAKQTSTDIQKFHNPQELTLAVNMGVELGRNRPNDYTAAPNSKQQFTDLRAAYTVENTISNQVNGVRVENRDYNSYKAQRERAPDVYSHEELAHLQAFEAQKKQQEEQRRIRAAQEHITARDYFERMKQLVITDK